MENKYFKQVIKVADNINTDIISPPQYMELPLESAAKYTMTAMYPDFPDRVNQNTVLVAGNNFGSGSSRETSPMVLKLLGIQIIIAKSFARIFYRNCINLGIMPIECKETDRICDNDELEIDVKNGKICNRTNSEVYECDKFPSHILDLIEAGGLFESLMKNRKN